MQNPFRKIMFVVFLFFVCTFSQAQNKKTIIDTDIPDEDKGFLVPTTIIDGDTVMHLYLKQIIVFPPRVFRSKGEQRRYSRLVYYVKKVYPYSQVVKNKLYEINSQVNEIKGEKAKRKFLKMKEDELRAEFEGELRKMTFTQGRILIKLIDRETGETTYEIVKQLKGSLSAFFWQSVAVMFQSSLKYEYDAKGDDRMIEEIVILIENGQL